MSYLTSDLEASPMGLYNTSTLDYSLLGSRAVSGDGREYRIARNGAVALTPGTLLQAAPEVANHQNLAPSVNRNIGDNVVTLVLGATAVTANQYAGGWLFVTTSTGQGFQYKIAGHPAANASATLTVVLDDRLVTTWASASTKIDMIANQYAGVVINPIAATSNPIGVAVTNVPANQFFWAQVKGPCNLLADGAIVTGTNVIASNAVAGAIEPGADAADLQANVGIAMASITTAQYGPININL